MSEFKGTPGTWVADDYAYPASDRTKSIYVRSSARHWSMAQVSTGVGCTASELDISESEARANARLIAAAPELLEAAQALVKADDARSDVQALYESACELARAAIAKALGEGQ